MLIILDDDSLQQANVFMNVFDGGFLENKIMAKVGCVNYTATEWVPKKVNVCERKVNYKLNTHMSILDGEVASIQQKARTADGNGWIVNEVMTIHNVPFGDHFHVCNDNTRSILFTVFLGHDL